MPDQLQLRGGTTAQHTSFTGVSKEVTIDTTKKTAVVHDGSTAGGNPLLREDGSNSALALGSAGTPSLKFTGDTNTGIYSPGADQVALSTGGAGRLFIDASGRVGVGVSSPQSLFHVDGDATAIRVTRGSAIGFAYHTGTAATDSFRIQSNGGAVDLLSAASQPITLSAGGSEKVRVTSAGLVGIGISSPGVTLDVAGTFRSTGIARLGTGETTTLAYIGNPDTVGNKYITFGRAAALTDIVNIQGADAGVGSASIALQALGGNVGIGTTSPAYSLDVRPTGLGLARVGSQDNQAGLYISSGNNSSPFINFLTSTSTLRAAIYAAPSSDDLIIATGPSATERGRFDASGRFLVGTSSARSNFFNTSWASQFQVEATNDQASAISNVLCGNNANGATVILGKTRATSVGGNTVVTSGDDIGLLSFQGADGTELVEAARITAQVDGTPGANDMPGRLVFSTTADGASSPTERMRIGSGGDISLNSGKFGVNVDGYTEISILNNASNNGFILDTGDGGAGNRPKFRIRYGTADQIYLDGNGTAQKPGGGSWAATSDVRSKEAVVDYTSGLAEIKQIQPRSYRYIGNDTTYVGLVAQEAEGVMPELVKQGKGTLPDGTEVEDFRTLDQTPLTFALINAVKELAAEVEALKAQLA